jgi:hypothetical protein
MLRKELSARLTIRKYLTDFIYDFWLRASNIENHRREGCHKVTISVKRKRPTLQVGL